MRETPTATHDRLTPWRRWPSPCHVLTFCALVLAIGQPWVRTGFAAPLVEYLNISGPTFTPSGNVDYAAQVIGCVNQMPQGVSFEAPVHLPQGAVVKSILLQTFDTTANAATSTADLIINDGKGGTGVLMQAKSRANVSGYQKNGSSSSPATIDNKRYSYFIDWRKDLGPPDSTLLSLCGVRITYKLP